MKAIVLKSKVTISNQMSKMLFGQWGRGYLVHGETEGLIFRGQNESLFFPSNQPEHACYVSGTASYCAAHFFVEEILPTNTVLQITL